MGRQQSANPFLNLMLVNNVAPNTTLYRYMQTIRELFNGENAVKVSSLFMPTSATERFDPIGFYDYWLNGFKNYKLNLVLNKYMFKKGFPKIKQDTETVIHYMWDGVMPPFTAKHEIVTIHDSPTSKGERKFYNNGLKKYVKLKKTRSIFYNKDVWRRFPIIIANTTHVATGLREVGFDNDIRVLWQPIRKEFFPIYDKNSCRFSLGLPINKVLILSISSSDERKNLGAIHCLANTLPEKYKIVRVGNPIPLALNIRKLSVMELNLLYNAVDLVIVPSFEEGFGYPIIEAMATLKPVICSDISPFRELLDTSAIFFDPTSVQSMKDALISVTSNQELAQELKEKLQARKPLFSMDIYKEKLTKIYSDLIRI